MSIARSIQLAISIFQVSYVSLRLSERQPVRKLVVAKLDGKVTLMIKQHWVAVLVLIAYLGLAITYSVIIPMWEAFDEDGHYQYARYIAANWVLPQLGDPATESISEKIQPPLYYILAASVIRLVGDSQFSQPVLNPYMSSGKAGINYAIHSAAENAPYRGTVLAVHLVRLLSVLIGAIAILFTYLIGLLIAPRHREVAVGAMLLHAFWPQFLFSSSVVSNDVLASAMGSLVTYCLLKMLRQGFSGLRVISLCAALGLALVTKLNTLVLVPIAVIVLIKVIFDQLHEAMYRKILRLLGMALIVFLLVLLVQWLLQRMSYFQWSKSVFVLLYQRKFEYIFLKLLTSMSGGIVGQNLLYLLKTSYASFGWGNLEIASPYYYVSWAVQTLFITGAVIAICRHRIVIQRSLLLVCGLIFLSFVFEVLMIAVYAHDFYGAHGRYLMPGMSAYMILLAAGFSTLVGIVARRLPRRNRSADHRQWRYLTKIPLGVGGAVIFSVALILPFQFIQPAYSRPLPINLASINIKNPLSLKFGNQVELLGYEVNPQVLQPGEMVDVVLYWRCLTKMEVNYTVAVKVLDAEQIETGGIDSYPGRGNNATTLWNPGEIVQDSYRFLLAKGFPTQSYAQIQVTVYQKDTMSLLPVTDADGKPIGSEVTFGLLRVSTKDDKVPETAIKDGAMFGTYFALLGYELPIVLHPGETETAVFYWESLQHPDMNYTVFVHLVDDKGNVVSQGDSPPRHGQFPTIIWVKGDIVQDAHTIAIPLSATSGRYSLRVGFYRLDNMTRLPVTDSTGQSLDDSQITIQGLIVN
jgi:hypothetical protein